MVHIYHGDGKGKTTAAMGAALRALGHGWRVCIVQFLKDGTSGEVRVLAGLPGVTVMAAPTGGKFTFQMDAEELAGLRRRQESNLAEASRLLREGACDLLVLDEVLDALATSTLDEDALVELLERHAHRAEVILTGRGPSDRLRALASYITRMDAERHPYGDGAPAREGVEW